MSVPVPVPAAKPLLNQVERPGSQHYVILALSWAGWLFDFYDLVLYSFLLGPIAHDLNFTRTESSLVLGVSLGFTAMGGVVFGRLADHFGRKTVLQWTILCYSAGAFLSGLAIDLPTLVLARIVTAVGVGGEWATGQTVISETFPAKQRGHYGALMQTGAPLGVGLAAIMGSFFAPVFGWRVTFMVSALPALLVTAIRRYMPESDIWEATVAGSVQRLRPKLMTVSVVMASLVPIMWSTGVGSDVMKPIAAPIVGGMITSTIHVLVITPVIFYIMKRRALARGTLRVSDLVRY